MEWWRNEALLIIEHEHNAYLKCVMITKIHVFCFVGYNHPNIIKAVQDPKNLVCAGKGNGPNLALFFAILFFVQKE